MWRSWLLLSSVWMCVHFTSDLVCLYCTAGVSVGCHKNVRYFLSIIPWLSPLDRCSVQTGYYGKKRQVLGHFVDFTAADIIQVLFFVFSCCVTSARVNGSLCGGRYPYTPLVSFFPHIDSHSLPFYSLISSSSPPLVLLLLDDYELPLKLRAKCMILNFSV